MKKNSLCKWGGFERNSAHTWMQTWVQKPRAFALLVFRTAIVMWGLSILEAAQGASDVTGVSAYTVRKWASSYYLALIGTPPDDIDDDDPQRDILSPSSCILQTHPYFFFGAYLCAVMALAAALEGISSLRTTPRQRGGRHWLPGCAGRRCGRA